MKAILCSIYLGTAAGLIPDSVYNLETTSHFIEIVDGRISSDKKNRPPIVAYADGKGYIVTHNYSYIIDGFEIVIPKGFLFDGASVPRMFWSVIGSPLESDFVLGALLHDYCYWSHVISKEKADDFLKICLKADGVGSLRTNTIYQSVNWFGGCPYKKGENVSLGSRWMISKNELVPVI